MADTGSIGVERGGHNQQIREPDHTRPDARDDNVRLAAPPATVHATNRGDAKPPRSIPNSLGENDSDYRARG
jgi:hypothetical protein